MAQVKFYSTTAASYAAQVSANTVNGGGVYFVDGGELYKGTSRFGANKVWTTKPDENAGVIGGDLYINAGVTEVFDGVGKSWVSITNTNGWTSVSFGGEGSYIQAVSQGSDGAITATAVAFPVLAGGTDAGTVKLGDGSDVTVTGWSNLVASVSTNATTIASVSTALESLASTVASVSGRVTDLESVVSAADGGTVTASSGTFTNLTVTSTATFSATTVSATTLTVGGSTIETLISAGADARISAAKLSGSISSSEGTGLVNEGQVVTYVSAAIQSFDNAMHYIGITETEDMAQGWTGTPTITGKTYTEKKAGDIVLKGTSEYIWNGSSWEIIGDQGVYATKAELSASWSTLGTAAFVDTSTAVAADATTLPTGGAVASYVSSVIDELAGSSSDSDKGIAVEVVTADGQVSSVDVGVTLDTDIGPSTGTGAATDDEIPSSLAVRKAIESAISDATLVWLGADGNALT